MDLLQIALVCMAWLVVSFTAAAIIGMCIPPSNSRNLRNIHGDRGTSL